MLAVGFDRQRNVLLLTLLDTFDNGTLAVMDAACATFFDAEGPSHAIFDFTSTQKVVMAPLSLERRAGKPAMCVGFERIIVVPQPEIRALAEKFRLHQSSAGLPAPHVVEHHVRSRAASRPGTAGLRAGRHVVARQRQGQGALARRGARHAAFAFKACATFEAGSRPSATQISRPARAMASRSTPCSMPSPFIR